MKIEVNDPPRVFAVGRNGGIKISDCGEIRLDPDEQMTFITTSGRRYDVAAKVWGFYATPSINGRLKKEGFKTALVKNNQGRYYVMLVQLDKIKEFDDYLKSEQNKIERWLDEA